MYKNKNTETSYLEMLFRLLSSKTDIYKARLDIRNTSAVSDMIPVRDELTLAVDQ